MLGFTEGQKVEVYRNLHKKCWSVRDCKTRKVVAHVDGLTLTDVKLCVSEAGRQRVLREKRKNVHAVVRGVVPPQNLVWQSGPTQRASYNPYRAMTFVGEDGRGVFGAERAYLTEDGKLLVVNPR